MCASGPLIRSAKVVSMMAPGHLIFLQPQRTRPSIDSGPRRVVARVTVNVSGDTPTPSTPAALAATSMTRNRFRGSTGPPSSVVNTRPLPLPLIARPQPLGLLLGAVLAQTTLGAPDRGHILGTLGHKPGQSERIT